MSKFDSPSQSAGLHQSSTFSSESCMGEYTQMRDRLKKLLSPKNSDGLYELLLLLKNADLFGRETVSKIDTLFSEIANCTPEDDLTHVELADCFVSTLLSYIDEEYYIELLQNIILHTKNNSLILSCENRLFELVFVLRMGVVVDKLRNPLGLVYVLLKSSSNFNQKFVTSKVSQDESRVNLGYLLSMQIFNSMTASSSLHTYNFSTNFEQNEVFAYISGLKLDNRNLKEFLNKEYFSRICEQIVYYCGAYTNSIKFLENLLKICKFIQSKDVSRNKSYRNLSVSILTQRFVNPLFQADLVLTLLENMYNELISTDFKEFQSFSQNFTATFGFKLNNPFTPGFDKGPGSSDQAQDEYKHDDDLDYDYGEENLLKSDLFFNLFPSAQEEDLVDVYWVLETDLLFVLFHSLRSQDHASRFSQLFLSLFKNSKSPPVFSRALIFKLSLIWSDYQNLSRANYNPISLKIVTMNEQYWFLFERSLSNLVPRSVLLSEVRDFEDDFKDKRCESLYDFMLNIAIHTDSDCFFIVLLELLRFSGYDYHVLKYSVQMFQSTLLEFFKHNRVRFSRGVLEIVCFCRQHFDWGFMMMLIYSIDSLITGDSDKYAKTALSDGFVDYLTWKLRLETDFSKTLSVEDTDASVILDQNDLDEFSSESFEDLQVTRLSLSTSIVAEIFYILHHLVGPTDVVLELFFLYNHHMKALNSYNVLLFPLYRGIESKLKSGEREPQVESRIEDESGRAASGSGARVVERPEQTGSTLHKLDLSDKTHFTVGPNKDIYGYLLLNEDADLTTSHVVTLIFSGKMAKNVLNAIKLLNSEEGSRSQYILDLILRKLVNKLQQLFALSVSEDFCLHMQKGSQEEETLVRNLRLLSNFLSGLVSLHLNSVHIDSIYLVFMTLLECLRSDTLFLIEFSLMTFNNIKNLSGYPMFTREFVSDPKVAKFYPSLAKSFKAVLSSPDSVCEISTTLDQSIANEVILQEKFAEDKCLKDNISKGLVIIKSEEQTHEPTSLTVSSLPSTASPAPLPQSLTPSQLPSQAQESFELLVGLLDQVSYSPPKMQPLFCQEQCLMTILNVGVDDFFNALKLQIEAPENSAGLVSAFTFSGPQFVSAVESLVQGGNLDFLFYLLLHHGIVKGEAGFGEIASLLQTLGSKAIDCFVKFLSFALNVFLKYLKSCRALLVYKKILLVCASLLGEFTVSRNKPLLTKHLNVKLLLYYSYEKGMLSVTIPFVCRLMSYVAKGTIFKLPNPWTFCVLSLLNEIKGVKNLKQVLVSEVNNLLVLLMSPKNQQLHSSPLQTSQPATTIHSTPSTMAASPDNLNSVMKTNIVGNNPNIGSHVKEMLRHKVLSEFDQSCRFSGNIWSNSSETKLKIPPIHNDIKLLLKRKIVINSKLLTATSLSTATGTVSIGSNLAATSTIVNTIVNMDLYKLMLNAIESCYRESVFVIERIVPVCVSTCAVISKVDFAQDTSLELLKRCLTSMTTGLSTSLVNVFCKEVLLSILSSEIYQSLLTQYSLTSASGQQSAANSTLSQPVMVTSGGSNLTQPGISIAGGSNLSQPGISTSVPSTLSQPGISTPGSMTSISTAPMPTISTAPIPNSVPLLGASGGLARPESYPVFDCIWLEYISQILARDNLALVCALVEQLTLELMGRSLDEMINSWASSGSSAASSISSILYSQFISTLHSGAGAGGSYYVGGQKPRNPDELSLVYKRYLSLVPSTISRVERTEKRPSLRFPDFFIVPPIESIPTNLVICKFDEFEQRLRESAKYLLMYPPIVPMANCKFLYKCESSSLLLLSFLPKNHQIFTLLWSVHYVIVKALNVAECYELILNRVVKNLVDSKAVSIPSIVNEVELSLLEMLCVDNANLLNITTSLLPNLTFSKLVLFLRFKLIKVSSLDIYLCNSGDLEFVVKMVYRLIVESSYVTLKELPLSVKFLSKFDKNSVIHSIGEPTKLNVVLTKLFGYSNLSTVPNASMASSVSSSMAQNTPMTASSTASNVDRLISLRLLFVNRLYIRNRCIVQNEVSKKHINMYIEFVNCESDSDVDLFFINFNENPIDHFITSALLMTLYISYQTTAYQTNSYQSSLYNISDGVDGVKGEQRRERDAKRLLKFDGIPRVTFGSPNFEYVPVFCRLANGFIQTDVFILQKVLHILLSVLYKGYCLPVFFRIIQSFINNANYTFSAHVSISQFLLYCNPTEMTSFAPFWVQLATSKVLIQSLIQSPVEWHTLSQLIKYTLIYYTTTTNSTSSTSSTTGSGLGSVTTSTESLLDSILNILLYLLQVCPEFICGYYLSFCEVTGSVRIRNIFTFSTPKNVKCSNPATASEPSELSPLSFVNHIQYVIQKPTLKALTDAYISEPSERLIPLILKELQPEGIVMYYTLYLGYTLPLLISKIGNSGSATAQVGAGNTSVKVINCYLLLENLVIHSKSKLLVSSMLLHTRYPNLVTTRFVSIFKNLFERADNVQELVITCILERLLVKPHPWGVVHLLFQLVKFKKFWTFVQHNKQVEEHLKKIKNLYIN